MLNGNAQHLAMLGISISQAVSLTDKMRSLIR